MSSHNLLYRWGPLSALLHVVGSAAFAGTFFAFDAWFLNKPVSGGLPDAGPSPSAEVDIESETAMAPPAEQPPPPERTNDQQSASPIGEQQPKIGPSLARAADAGLRAVTLPKSERSKAVARLAGVGTLPGTAISATFDVNILRSFRVTADSTVLDLIDQSIAMKRMFHGSHVSLSDCQVAAVVGASPDDDDAISVCKPGSSANWQKFTTLGETDFTKATHPSRPIPRLQPLGDNLPLRYAVWPYGASPDRVIITVDPEKYVIIGRFSALHEAMKAPAVLPARVDAMMALSCDEGGPAPFLLLRMTHAFAIPKPNCFSDSAVYCATRSGPSAEETRLRAEIAFSTQASAESGETCVEHDQGIETLQIDFPDPPSEGVLSGVAHLKDDSFVWLSVQASLGVGAADRYHLGDDTRIEQERKMRPDVALPNWGSTTGGSMPNQ